MSRKLGLTGCKAIYSLEKYLKENLPKEFSFEKDKKYEIEKYGKVFISLEVMRGNWQIAAISAVDDTDENPDRTFMETLRDTLHIESWLNPIFFVISYHGNIYLWRNYSIVPPVKKGKSPFVFTCSESNEFLQSGVDSSKIVSREELIRNFLDYKPDTYCKITQEDLQLFFMKDYPKSKSHSIWNLITTIQKGKINDIVEGNVYFFWFKEDFEDKLFKNILRADGCCSEYYRYINRSSLSKLLENGTIAMSSIISMNDMSEINYANNYIRARTNTDNIIKQVSIKPDNEDLVNTYICSLSEEDDDLAMWYMYGEQCKGAELIFKVPNEEETNNGTLWLSKVSYADKDGHHEWLSYIANLLKSEIGGRRLCLKRWHIWQHFFKPYYYRNEKEVRLLYFPNTLSGDLPPQQQWCNNDQGVHFPLTIFLLNANHTTDKSKGMLQFPLKLKTIKLGPLYPENQINASSWEVDLRQRWKTSIKFAISGIKDYRG